MQTRQTYLDVWLKSQFTHYRLYPLVGDASFRRYFRLVHENKSYIVMDAPPPTENCGQFIAVANALRQLGLCVPEIFASDVNQGFLLLTDFGNQILLKTLTPSNVVQLYQTACDSLTVLQTCKQIVAFDIPALDAHFMRNELLLTKQWFLETHVQLDLSAHENMLNDFFYFLCEVAAAQPQVYIHRDFQTQNLMVLKNNALGILDFQDGFVGPITYDLVSLLKDCYIMWPEKMITAIALRFKTQVCAEISDNEFMRWFDLMGVQRHLKALLTFSRKFHRDNNANYLRHIPRTLNYILQTCARYDECKSFFIFLNTVLLPTFEKETELCMQ